MAWRLGDRVVEGLLDNREESKINGWLRLQDGRRIELTLRGKAMGTLAGKMVRLVVPESSYAYFGRDRPRDWLEFASQQVGVARELKYDLRRVSSDLELVEAGPAERSVTKWLKETGIDRPCLVLEWFGQNGRALLEVVEPELVVLDTVDGEVSPHPLEPTGNAWGETLEACLTATSSSPHSWPWCADEDQFLPVAHMLRDDVPQWPSPEQVTDEKRAEELVQQVLDRLSDFQIYLEICDHYDGVGAYRLLMQEFIPFSLSDPALVGTNVRCHYDAFDRCPECTQELED